MSGTTRCYAKSNNPNKDKYCMYHLYAKSLKKLNSYKHRVGKSFQGFGGRGVGWNRERLVKGCKLSVVRWIKSEDLMYDMVTIADDTVLYNRNLLEQKIINVHPHKPTIQPLQENCYEICLCCFHKVLVYQII